MRVPFFSLAMALALTGLAHAADTAYTALQVVGKKLGSDSLNRVVEVQGRYGAPEPVVWKVTLASNDGGYREVEVQKGKITADRSPTRGPSGQALDFNKLNLDSEGVFTLVNQEAQKAKVPFDRVDYTLTSTDRTAAPVWKIQMWDGQSGQVGQFTIAADNGNILKSKFDNSSRRNVPPPADPRLTDRGRYPDDDRAYVDGDAPPDDRYRDRDRDYRYDDRRDYDDDDYRGSGGGGFAGKVQRHFERRGAQIKKFFSGGYFH